MKNFGFYTMISILYVLSGCAVTKQSAPIEYHNGNSSHESPKGTNESTISTVNDNEETIASISDEFEQGEFVDANPDLIDSSIKSSTMSENEFKEIDDEIDLEKRTKDHKEEQKPLVTIKKKEPIKQVRVVTDYINPVNGKVLTKFGEKTKHGVNKGINITAPAGTKVVASATGKVIYADYDAIFGNLVIMKLDNKNIVISYAHFQDIIVKKGAVLKQGDLVGHVGKSGKIESPQLHFAVREGKHAVDPLKFVKY